ncbi:hypothetical protein HO173_000091 [Letharia columbiana]|uniref:Uncharacterized protein n=1 Tax=Letharia columbiana TaxID=112416 RepID=A0A8H6G6E4_9LECA|nr:uncharacterized protein HO173_000091 [Letharia columbiana]KAF6241381.1 hypothetical protein HO173_000091 [Letharia columbiana]
MPPRIGRNGAVVKPSLSTKSQQTAGHTASKVIDLTRESTDETSGKSSGEESAEDEEIDDVPERHGERPDGRRGHRNSSAGMQGRVLGAVKAKESILEYTFIVTILHHRPWGMGDDHATVGVFPTEKEGEEAASKDFLQRCKSQADGWESEWRPHPRDGMLQLCGCCEDGEVDSERYTASIKRVQQKRVVTVQPCVPSAAQSKPRVVKPRHVYLVIEEQRINIGTDDPRGFYNGLGDAKSADIHGIYVDLSAANDSAREIYYGIVGKLDGEADTVTDTLKNGMARILVANHTKMMTYSLSVIKRSLK